MSPDESKGFSMMSEGRVPVKIPEREWDAMTEGERQAAALNAGLLEGHYRVEKAIDRLVVYLIPDLTARYDCEHDYVEIGRAHV